MLKAATVIMLSTVLADITSSSCLLSGRMDSHAGGARADLYFFKRFALKSSIRLLRSSVDSTPLDQRGPQGRRERLVACDRVEDARHRPGVADWVFRA